MRPGATLVQVSETSPANAVCHLLRTRCRVWSSTLLSWTKRTRLDLSLTLKSRAPWSLRWTPRDTTSTQTPLNNEVCLWPRSRKEKLRLVALTQVQTETQLWMSFFLCHWVSTTLSSLLSSNPQPRQSRWPPQESLAFLQVNQTWRQQMVSNSSGRLDKNLKKLLLRSNRSRNPLSTPSHERYHAKDRGTSPSYSNRIVGPVLCYCIVDLLTVTIVSTSSAANK